MTNSQARLIALPIALLGGAVAANATSLDVNVGLVIILISGVLFLGEYVRSQKK